jgi:hypothetical protein
MVVAAVSVTTATIASARMHAGAAEPWNHGHRFVEVGGADNAGRAGFGVIRNGQRSDAAAGLSCARENTLALSAGIRFRRHLETDGVMIG